jgi:hypothetical protein
MERRRPIAFGGLSSHDAMICVWRSKADKLNIERRRRQMEQKAQPTDLAPAVIPLAVALVVGNSIVLALIHARTAPPEILQAAVAAFVSSEGSLVAIWIAFGSHSLPVRLAIAVPGAAMIFVPFFIEDRPDAAAMFATALLLVVIVAIPLLLMRATGRRLIRFVTDDDAKDWQRDENPAQFTLRQMFGWTLAVAMVAGLARLVAGTDDFRHDMPRELLATGAVCLACGAMAYGAAWAALGRRNPAARLAGVAAIATLLGWAILMLLSIPFGAPVEAVFMVMAWVVLDALMTGCALLLFRAVGFRLVRASRSNRRMKKDL